MGSEIWKPNHLKSGQMVAILLKKLNLEKNVRISNVLVFECLGLQPQPQLKPKHLKSDLQKVWISNVSGFQTVRFQIPMQGIIQLMDCFQPLESLSLLYKVLITGRLFISTFRWSRSCLRRQQRYSRTWRTGRRASTLRSFETFNS